MSRASEIILGIVALLSALLVLYFIQAGVGLLFGWLALEIFLLTMAAACLFRTGRKLTLRVLGAFLFAVCAGYLATELRLGQPGGLLKSLMAFFVFGLPALYLMVRGRYPRWGRFAPVFAGKAKTLPVEAQAGCVVRVVKLLREERPFQGSKGVERAPRVGDVGAIVHVYDPNCFAVECVARDGRTVWLADFYGEELEVP